VQAWDKKKKRNMGSQSVGLPRPLPLGTGNKTRGLGGEGGCRIRARVSDKAPHNPSRKGPEPSADCQDSGSKARPPCWTGPASLWGGRAERAPGVGNLLRRQWKGKEGALKKNQNGGKRGSGTLGFLGRRVPAGLNQWGGE